MRKRHFFISLTAVAAILSLPGCREGVSQETVTSGKSEREFSVTGVVRLPVQNGQIMIEHDEIAGFMPAMTMPFLVADETVAAGLAIGDRVRFRFVVGDASRADRFEVVGREAPRIETAATLEDSTTVKRLKAGELVPDFNLIDHLGEPVTAEQLDDRLTLVTFIFTRCAVPEFCPAIMQRFAALQARIKEDGAMRERVRLLGVSLDPEFDRPEILRQYADATGVDAGQWRLATGDSCCVGLLAKAFSVHSEKRAGTLDHTLCTALIGPDRRVLEIWRGNGWKTDEVLAGITEALGAW